MGGARSGKLSPAAPRIVGTWREPVSGAPVRNTSRTVLGLAVAFSAEADNAIPTTQDRYMATYIEVQQQIQALQKEAEALKAAERKGVIERMREAIAVYDITAVDLGLAGGARQPKSRSANSPKAAKQGAASANAAYSDGKGNTWGGRGPRPRWLKEALAAGAKLEEFAR